MDRKRVALVGLLILLLLALLYGYWQSPRQGRVGSKSTSATRTTTAAREKVEADGAPATSGIPALRRDLLQRPPEAYSGVRQNLFRSSTPADVAPEPVVAVEPEPVVPIPPPKIEPPLPVEPTPEEIVKRELARLTFLGFLKKGDERTIFLASEGEIFLVHKGDSFGRVKEFLVTSITPVVMTVTQIGVGEIVIPLVEQTPLAPSKIGGGREEKMPVPVPTPPPVIYNNPNPSGPGGLRGPLRRSHEGADADEE